MEKWEALLAAHAATLGYDKTLSPKQTHEVLDQVRAVFDPDGKGHHHIHRRRHGHSLEFGQLQSLAPMRVARGNVRGLDTPIGSRCSIRRKLRRRSKKSWGRSTRAGTSGSPRQSRAERGLRGGGRSRIVKSGLRAVISG